MRSAHVNVVSEATRRDDAHTRLTVDWEAPPSGVRHVEPPPPVTFLDDDDVVEDIDDSAEATGVSDVVGELARLANPSCSPYLNRPVSGDDVLTPPEAFIASLVEAKMPMQTLIDMSPMPEDATVRFLATLVEKGIVSLALPARTRRRKRAKARQKM
jgi:hypothetical protein